MQWLTWFDDALETTKGERFFNRNGCYNCGDQGHFKCDCPWMNANCDDFMAMKTLKQAHSLRYKYLKCKGYS